MCLDMDLAETSAEVRGGRGKPRFDEGAERVHEHPLIQTKYCIQGRYAHDLVYRAFMMAPE